MPNLNRRYFIHLRKSSIWWRLRQGLVENFKYPKIFKTLMYLRTFARKTSTTQIFFILLWQSDNQLLLSEMQQKNEGHRLCFWNKACEKQPQFSQIGPRNSIWPKWFVIWTVQLKIIAEFDNERAEKMKKIKLPQHRFSIIFHKT